jgi:hypothetical protein
MGFLQGIVEAVHTYLTTLPDVHERGALSTARRIYQATHPETVEKIHEKGLPLPSPVVKSGE